MRIIKKFPFNFSAFLLLMIFISAAVFGQAEILSQSDKNEIAQKLDSLMRFIESGDVQGLLDLIKPENTDLRQEIQRGLERKPIFYYLLDYSPLEENIEVLDTNKIRVKARFTASGLGWSISGVSTYFVFEKYNDQWLISDTDFHQKLGFDYVFKIIKKILAFVGPIFILLFAFSLWMLIDAITRDFDNKIVWIIVIIFLNFAGALLYYFLIKKRNITRKSFEPKS